MPFHVKGLIFVGSKTANNLWLLQREARQQLLRQTTEVQSGSRRMPEIPEGSREQHLQHIIEFLSREGGEHHSTLLPTERERDQISGLVSLCGYLALVLQWIQDASASLAWPRTLADAWRWS